MYWRCESEGPLATRHSRDGAPESRLSTALATSYVPLPVFARQSTTLVKISVFYQAQASTYIQVCAVYGLDQDIAANGPHCIRCRISTKAVETQTVAAFSLGLRDDLVFRAHSSSGRLSALLLDSRGVCRALHHYHPRSEQLTRLAEESLRDGALNECWHRQRSAAECWEARLSGIDGAVEKCEAESSARSWRTEHSSVAGQISRRRCWAKGTAYKTAARAVCGAGSLW